MRALDEYEPMRRWSNRVPLAARQTRHTLHSDVSRDHETFEFPRIIFHVDVDFAERRGYKTQVNDGVDGALE